MDPLSVDLAPGGAFAFTDRWFTGEALTAGVSLLSARYTGSNPGHVNSGQSVTRFWSGKLASEAVPLTVGP
ncbi:MAG: hypothetical protein JST92_07535 [Deltaproteobacteria bacterium]|nr:hypothetical protein [Deltaproteobacteria bacterium]